MNSENCLTFCRLKKGSESCPIDLTDFEETPSVNDKVKDDTTSSFNHTHTDDHGPKTRSQRLESIEKKLKKALKHGANYSDLNGRLLSLDSRIGKIEDYLKNFSKTLSGAEFKIKTSGQESVKIGSDTSKNKVVLSIGENRKTIVEDTSSKDSNKDKCETETNSSITERLINNQPDNSFCKTNEVDNGKCSINGRSPQTTSMNNQILDSLPSIKEGRKEDNRPTYSTDDGIGGTQTCHGSGEVKLEPLSIVSSVREELPLLRDEFGRILIFLCSVAKMMLGSKDVVGIAGTYLQKQLHNEYVFKKDDTLKNVKLEAEMKSALFGLEIVKTLFPRQKGLCVMIISSCLPLVKMLKKKHVYPAFHSCTCEPGNCQHSRNRWSSNESLAKTHIHILPKLILSMECVQAHWCLPRNLSDEEKKIMHNYEVVVQSTLSDFIKTSLR